jgi:hypothetical protein
MGKSNFPDAEESHLSKDEAIAPKTAQSYQIGNSQGHSSFRVFVASAETHLLADRG